VKISRSGLLCVLLAMFFWAAPGGAQQQPPATPTPPSTPSTSPSDQPQPYTGIRQPPPPLPKIPDVRQPGETGYWVGVMGWFPLQNSIVDKGKAAAFTDPTHTALQGTPKYAAGAEVGIALGLHNALRFTYFDTRAAGDTTIPAEVTIWSQAYTAGTLLSTNLRVRNGKLSFDYLTWPYPVASRRFRLKTLWGVEYTGISTGFDAPLLPLYDSSGNPLVDSSGNVLSYMTSGNHWYFSPALGMGVAYFGSRRFRVEANGSGFAIPHHTTTWDADVSANFRSGHWEFRVGAKGFHFKTSTQAEYYMRGTLGSGFVGLRWYSD